MTECLASSMGSPSIVWVLHLVYKPELLTCGHVHNVPVVSYMEYLDVHEQGICCLKCY